MTRAMCGQNVNSEDLIHGTEGLRRMWWATLGEPVDSELNRLSSLGLWVGYWLSDLGDSGFWVLHRPKCFFGQNMIWE